MVNILFFEFFYDFVPVLPGPLTVPVLETNVVNEVITQQLVIGVNS